MIEGGKAEYAQEARSCLKDRVNERRHGGALADHQEATENDHHDQNRQKPEFLSDPHESPQFGKEGHDIYISFVLKLTFHGFRLGARRVALNPIALGARIRPKIKRPFA